MKFCFTDFDDIELEECWCQLSGNKARHDTLTFLQKCY